MKYIKRPRVHCFISQVWLFISNSSRFFNMRTFRGFLLPIAFAIIAIIALAEANPHPQLDIFGQLAKQVIGTAEGVVKGLAGAAAGAAGEAGAGAGIGGGLNFGIGANANAGARAAGQVAGAGQAAGEAAGKAAGQGLGLTNLPGGLG